MTDYNIVLSAAQAIVEDAEILSEKKTKTASLRIRKNIGVIKKLAASARAELVKQDKSL